MLSDWIHGLKIGAVVGACTLAKGRPNCLISAKRRLVALISGGLFGSARVKSDLRPVPAIAAHRPGSSVVWTPLAAMVAGMSLCGQRGRRA